MIKGASKIKFQKMLIAAALLILSCALLIALNVALDNDCLALSAFRLNSISVFLFSLVVLGAFVIILLAGFIIYFKYLTAIKVNLIVYFLSLSLIVCIPLIKNIFDLLTDQHRVIKDSICEKSTDDGMICLMSNLTYDEYCYLSDNTWLPSIPGSSENIAIEYYRDDFIGDFSLAISIWLPNDQIQDIDFEKWDSVKGKRRNSSKFVYHNHSP